MAKVYGTEEMIRKMLRIERAMEGAAVRSMEKNAEQLTAMQRRLVGKEELDLMDSIDWKPVDFKKGPGVQVTAGSIQAYYARWHEHGTSTTSANPFFFGSYRALKRAMRGRTTRMVRYAMRKHL